MNDNKLPEIAQTCGIGIRRLPMKINHLTSSNMCFSWHYTIIEFCWG